MKINKTITFKESDLAGVMYFANIFSMAHDAFEEYIQFKGLKWCDFFLNREIIIPIRRANAEYFLPLMPGQTYSIEVSISQMGKTSFTSQYEFKFGAKTHVIVNLVHVTVDLQSKKPIPLKRDPLLMQILNSEFS